MAEHNDGMRVRCRILVGHEESACCRSCADHLEIIARHEAGVNALGRTRITEAHDRRIEALRRNASQQGAPLAHLTKEWIAKIVVSLSAHRPADVDQSGGIGDADARPQQRSIGEAEDRRAGGDPGCEGQHGGDSEDRAPGEHPQGIPDVGKN